MELPLVQVQDSTHAVYWARGGHEEQTQVGRHLGAVPRTKEQDHATTLSLSLPLVLGSAFSF